MRHYKDSLILIFLNMLSELCIILLSYMVAGVARDIVGPFLRRPFDIYDMWHYFYLAIIMGIAIVIMNAFMRGYNSVHYRDIKAELISIAIIHGFAISIGFAILFSVRGDQLSRAFMLIFYVISVCMMTVKRIICNWLADCYVRKKQVAYRTLLVGGGELAKRCFKELCSGAMKRYEYVGYIAECENHKIENYLGDIDRFLFVLEHYRIEQVFLALDVINRLDLNRILSDCNVVGAEVKIIPVYNDFITDTKPIRSQNGLLYYDVNVMKTTDILGVNVAVTNMEKTVQSIAEHLEEWRGKYICVSNVHTTVMAYENLNYRKVQNRAVLVLPDGGPLSAYSRSSGSEEAKRVTGPDLMKELLLRSDEYGWKHVFYGSKQETLDKLKVVLLERYPKANIVGMISPPFRELTQEEEQKYMHEINEMHPDFVWVGLGAPKQELWMAAHEDKINALMIGVGAAFDYESGNIKRAPEWMQRLSLEWLYRLIQDPKRLLKRYFVTNIKYMWLTRNRRG